MINSIDFSKLDLKDSLDLAIHIELEAKARYEEFADHMGTRYQGDAGEFFLGMAVNESKHAAQLAERRQALFGNAPRTFDPEDIWDVEAPEFGAPRSYMSVKQAMEMALASEAKAYLFYTEALRQVKDPVVRKLFEELQQEEVEHQEMLKREIAKLPPGSDTPDRDEDDLDDPSSL